MRWTLARRVMQIGGLLAFFGTAHWGWKLAGKPLLAGDLSAASLVGLPLADPFAVLQILASRHPLATEALLGAAIVLALYAVLGRVFCAWVCPVNWVADAAGWLRARLGVASDLSIPAHTRFVVLALALLVSAVAGVTAFEWLSPIAMLHRELIFGAGLGLTAVLAIFLLDAFIVKHGWCGHLCPLGAFWTLIGAKALLRVGFDAQSCTRCGDCVRACPEPQILNFDRMTHAGFVSAGACVNCARCIAVCPEDSLNFGWRPRLAANRTLEHSKGAST
jgi:ferredoxin-type protein NapH